MLICKHCGQPVPDNRLACEPCLVLRGEQDRHDAQMEPLRRVHAGALRLITLATSKTANKPHIQLFRSDNETYCGMRVNSRYVRDRMSWFEVQSGPETCCKECRRMLEAAMRAALVEKRKAVTA